MKVNLTAIKDFRAGRKIQGFFLCREKNIRRTRAGDLYVDLLLQDDTGVIPAKIWDSVDDFKDRFKTGDPLAIKGTPSEYNGELQLTVTQVNVADAERYAAYGFAPEKLVPTIPESIPELFQELKKLSNKINNRFLKKLVKRLIKIHAGRLQVMPASVDHHHPVRGGFLKHLVSTGTLAVRICEYYSELDRDLVLAGMLLHDIGKLKSMQGNLEAEYSDDGRLAGHIPLGWELVNHAIGEIPDFPELLRQKLIHIVLAHQGYPAKGSPAVPRFPEALVVYYIDELDTRLDLMMRAIRQDSNAGSWTDKRNHFFTELFKK
ncbi:MAG: HD domain-containing protein [FCB group bacterium]|nr:HD domain-containing protein [FCB group bacterium]